ncbi:MAG: GNAT family N-acetyltransferase [Gemmatimonadetes bacterium]|nr:GNAT family N-acetyltransferase [Gemmatimonadota bacterium]
MPFADVDLARRLERTEGATNAALVDARAALDPESGATWTSVAGVYAMYDGPDSPMTQTFGLGIFEAVGAAELDALEAFFRERGAATMHEASPFVDPETLALLGERGYRPMELSTVLVRPVAVDDAAEGAVTARRIDAGEEATWARLSVEGWSSESPDPGPFFETFGRLITRARGVHCFVGELDGRPVAAAALSLHDDIALLAGASTIPAARRRGAQRALFETRLTFAASLGARLAMVVTQPGSASQRNAERQGFRVCYTRTKWRLEP